MITWKKLLKSLQKLPETYRDLPMVIGGDDCLEFFRGFDLVGPKSKNKPYTLGETISLLLDAARNGFDLEEQIPLDDKFDCIEETLFGDSIELMCVGPLRAHCACVDTENSIYPLEDYGDDRSMEDMQADMREVFVGGRILEPYSCIVIVTSDGSILVDDEESIIISNL